MPDLTRLNAFMERVGERFEVPGYSLIVKQGHRVIYDRMFGFSDSEKRIPARDEDLYWFYSCTKLYTCVAALQLLEQGLLRLEDRVSDYLPEYASIRVKCEAGTRPAGTEMTLRHLFTMTGGLNYDLWSEPIRSLVKETDGRASTRQLAAAFAEAPLEFDPGACFRYSLCHDVLAAVVEQVSGLPFGEYCRRKLFEPLGASSLSFSEEALPGGAETVGHGGRFAARWYYDTDRHSMIVDPGTAVYKLSRNHESGGAGLFGTAKDYALLPEALACGGMGLSGKRILKQETIALMSRDMLNEEQKKGFHTMLPQWYSYGLGVRTRVKTDRHGVPLGEFGWDGAGGCYTLIDPVNGLSLFYCQHILNFGAQKYQIQENIRSRLYDALADDPGEP